MPLPRNRRRATTVVALATAALVALGACTAENGDEGAGATEPEPSLIPPETAEAETATESTTTSVPEPTTTDASQPTAFAPSAREAIEGLKGAWDAGDQGAARAIAPGEVVDQLFAVPAEGFTIQGCDTGEFDTSTCNFRNRSNEAFIVVNAARTDAGWQVASIDVNLD